MSKEWIIRQWGDIAGNAKWDLLKLVARVLIGGSVPGFLYVAWEKKKNMFVDWPLFAVLCVVSFIIFAIASFRSRKHTGDLTKVRTTPESAFPTSVTASPTIPQCNELHGTIHYEEATLKLGEFVNIRHNNDMIHIELLEVEDDTGALLAIESGLAFFTVGESVRRSLYNKYWMPKDQLSSPMGRVTTHNAIIRNQFSLMSVSLYHVNPHSKQVTVIVTFVSIS